ncbi:MAG: HD domain-containing protein [Bacillota bacterium]|nr:HD domain-containing protein [Bacillota bacterium]
MTAADARAVIGETARLMMRHESGVPARARHLLAVHGYACLIADGEALTLDGPDATLRLIIELAALTHDIGIRPALATYGSSAGPLQEALGAPLARKLLDKLNLTPEITERVSELVGSHHSYGGERGLDHQILIEADFLVNFFESSYTKERIEHTLGTIFRTAAGKALARELYLCE